MGDLRSTKRQRQAADLSVHGEVNRLIRIIQSADTMNLFLSDPVVQYPIIAERYKAVCPERMWLKEMRRKCQSNEYLQFQQWIADFELMIKNCLLFNANEPRYSNEARRIYQEVIAQVQESQKLLSEASEKAKNSKADDIDQVPIQPKKRVQSQAKIMEEPAVPTEDTRAEAMHSPKLTSGTTLSKSELKFLETEHRRMVSPSTTRDDTHLEQTLREYSIKTFLAVFFEDAAVKHHAGPTMKASIQEILCMFNIAAPRLLFYDSEISQLRGSHTDQWCETLGFDFYLRFAYHFEDIARALGYTDSEIGAYTSLIQHTLKFVDKHLDELRTLKNENTTE